MKTAFALLFLLASVYAYAADFGVGMQQTTFKDATRNREIVTRLWYPVDPKSPKEAVEEGRAFTPLVVSQGAKLVAAPAKLPVVLLSRGTGGMGPRLFWLGGYLASNGYLVAAVDHPGNKA